MKKEIMYVACEQYRPYKVFETLSEAKVEIQPYVDEGFDFQIAELEVVAWHAGGPWKREACDE